MKFTTNNLTGEQMLVTDSAECCPQPSITNIDEVAEIDKLVKEAIIEIYGAPAKFNLEHHETAYLKAHMAITKALLTHSAAFQKELEETKHQLQYCSQPLYKQNELQLPYWIEVDGIKFNHASIRALQSEIESLRKDKERLDWFRERNLFQVIGVIEDVGDGQTLNQALDSAIAATKGEK